MSKNKRKYKLICNYCNKEFYGFRKNQLCCSHSCSNKFQAEIRKNTINPKTGLSLSKEYSKKAAISRKESGLYEKESFKKRAKEIFEETKESEVFKKNYKISMDKMREIDKKTGLTGFQKSAKKATKTKIKKGLCTSLEEKTEYERYKYLVWYFTNKNDLSKLKFYKKRGRAYKNKNNYHLDHIYSIFDGYNNKIPPEIIGHIKNLRFIPWIDNVSKNNNSDISIKELFERTGINYQNYYEEDYKEIKISKNSAEKMNNMRKYCKYCNKLFPLGAYKRWHGENCKEKE